MRTYSVDDYYDAKLNGRAITGWVIKRNGEPAYFQIEGRNGLCVPIDKVTDIHVVDVRAVTEQ